MPFRFGNVVATEGAHHFLDLEVRIDSERANGLSMVGIAPMWFLKDPDLPLTEQNERLLEVFDAACEHARALDAEPTVFEFWYGLYERQREWAVDTEHPPLLWGYGVSMVEQALVDAFCRHRGITFAEGIRTGAFGVEPGRIYPELEGESVPTYLPEEPVREAAVRHTVGLSDPLWGDEADTGELDDGLPSHSKSTSNATASITSRSNSRPTRHATPSASPESARSSRRVRSIRIAVRSTRTNSTRAFGPSRTSGSATPQTRTSPP
ncbi:hypothetical protein [Halalkalicoccus salilacus]|uniref:hypothetical protein n=1 Tax=Halalkalicoccus sp. GCM10025704 TaxID=3252662 RepID=UPI0036135F31